MTTTLIAQVDDMAKLKTILALFNRLQVPFENRVTDTVDLSTMAWNFKEQDADWENIGLKTLAEDTDWNSSYDEHWGKLYNTKTNFEVI